MLVSAIKRAPNLAPHHEEWMLVRPG